MLPADHDELPTNMLDDWQSIVDLVVKLSGVKVCLIMRVVAENIAVLISSNSENNPYHVGDQEHLKDSGLYCEAVIKSGQPLLVPNALKDPDWDRNPDLKFGLVSYLGFPIRLPDGNILGTLCVLDDQENHYSPDIIELMSKMRALVEGQLRLQEENRQHRIFAKESVVRKILDSVPVAIACAAANEMENPAIYLNRRFSEILGISLTASGDYHALPKISYSNPAEGIAEEIHLLDVFGRIADSPESIVRREISVQRSDGTWLDVIYKGSRIEDLLLITLIDITEQKANAEKLAEGQSRLNFALEASGLGYWDWYIPQDMAIFDDRSLSILGGKNEAPKNLALWQADIHPEDLATVRTRLQEHIDGNTPGYEAEYRKRHRDGHWVWILDRGKIVSRDANNQPLRMTGTHQDISQRKRLESDSATLLRQITRLINDAIKPRNELIDSEQAQSGHLIDQLTKRQTEILRLVASGLTSAEIADQLNISVDTVDTHRRDLARKLNIRSVAGLTKIAIQHGLL